MSGKDKNIIYIFFILFVCVRLFISLNNHWIYFFIDDAFYYFKIAQNIVSGLGISYDGHQFTNGFQPLFLLIILPIFFLAHGDLILPLQFVAIIQSLISLGIWILLYKTLRLFIDKWFALFVVALWSFSPSVVAQEMNGMETGLNLFFIALTSYYYLSYIIPSVETVTPRSLLVLGALVSCTVLSRLDGTLFLIALLIHLMFKIVQTHRELNWNTKVQLILKTSIAVAALPCCVLFPWLTFNYYKTGSALPISSQAIHYLSLNYGFAIGNFRDPIPSHGIPFKYYYENFTVSLMQLLSSNPVTRFVGKWFCDFFPLSSITNSRELNILNLLVLLILLLAIIMMVSVLKEITARVGFLVLFAMLLLCAYSFYIFGQWFYCRYYFPICFLITIFAGYIFYSVYKRLHIAHKNLGILFKVLLVAFYTLTCFLEIQGYFGISQKKKNTQFYTMIPAIEKSTPTSAVIGCFQSGIIGYFTNRTIINLDGKMNKEALAAMQAGQLGKYMLKQGITYVADWHFLLQTLFFPKLGNCQSIKKISPVYKGFFDIYRIEYGPH